MKQFVASKYKIWLLYIGFAFLLVMVIYMKKNYHVDEIYTSGLANNETGAMEPKLAPFTYTPAAEAYMEYMVVGTEEPFDLGHLWQNQAEDVHPPVYYVMVYLLSFLWKGRFTKWIAGLINVIFGLASLYFVRKILYLLDCSEEERKAVSLFFVCSAGIIASASFLRMYVVVMAEVAYITYLVLKYRDRPTFLFFGKLCAVSVLGALTHYYFLVYLFFLSIFYCCYQLAGRNVKSLLKYVVSMAAAGGLACLVFPAMLQHLFVRGRGKDAAAYLVKGGILPYWDKLKDFFNIISEELFGGILLFLLFAALFFVAAIPVKKPSLKREKVWEWLVLVGPSVCYFFFIGRLTQDGEVWSRYMSPIYGVLIVGVLHTLWLATDFFFQENKRNGKLVYIVVLAWMTASSWQLCRWSNLFAESEALTDKMSMYSTIDCLYVCKNVDYRIQADFLQVAQLRSVTFFEGDVSELQNMEELRQKPEFIVYIMDADAGEVIREIMEYCPQITNYEMMPQYLHSLTYRLY